MSSPTPPQESPQEEEDPPRDEEGLLLQYDVIICGTGLVQSILASALARAGKSVIHCDGNDYYGEYDAVVSRSFDWNQSTEEDDRERDAWSLRPRALVKLHSTETLSSVEIQVGTQVTTPYGVGEILSLPTEDTEEDIRSVVIELEHSKVDGRPPTLHVGIPAGVSVDEYLQRFMMTPTRLLQAQKVLQQDRSFAFDLTPSLLYASGPAVQALLTSGVAEYLEFKPLEGLLWSSGDSDVLSRVPCSKGDVFATSLLSPLEKRRLMKFLQLTLDYATSQQQGNAAAEDVDSVGANDNGASPSLTHVQSLNENHLNQGRSLARPQNKAVATSDLQVLDTDESLDMPFADYLSKHAKLSPNLSQLVQHALALEPSSSLSTRQGMSQLCQHVQSLGRYGTTAFLVPLYGSGELSQSFCRSAAVHGATYLLRRAPKRILVQDDKVQGILLDREGSGEEKIISCDHVVVAAHALYASCTKRLWRRISIVPDKLVEDQDEQRHVVIIPPGDVGNPYAIHGLLLDHSVHVAPPGCAVLHLTTTTAIDQDGDKILERATEKLKAQEIYHVSFSYALPDEVNEESVEGLRVCQVSGQSLTLDAAVGQAKDIFQSICSDVEFLTMSQEMDNIVKERLAGRDDDEDEERMVLESAMNMMDVSSAGEQILDDNPTLVD